MRLPAIPFLTKTVKTEFFLALIFESDKISSILFKEQEKTLIILSSHETKISLEEATVEDLVVACDNVISRLEISIPEGANLEKTIFAVPHSWVEDGKIKQERLNQLKKVSVELALIPMGFIVSIEAIVAFLQKKEGGAPLNGIFIELSEKFLTVFIVRKGNIIDLKHGVIEESVEKTVEELLGQVVEKLDVLPPKIVLLNNEEAEAVQQKFISHHWTKDLPFMHLPQVSILERGFEDEAIINGVATQLGVSIEDGHLFSQSEEDVENEDGVSISKDSFGFLQDEDVAIVTDDKNEKPIIPDEAVSAPVIHHVVSKFQEDLGEEVFEEDMPEKAEIHTQEKATAPKFLLMLSAFIPKGLSLKSLIKPDTFMKNGKSFLIPIVALLVVIIIIGVYYAFILKAQVILFTDQKAFKQDSMNITLSTSSPSSFQDKTLKISTIDESVSGEESQETTGQKDTGQKAQGSVTVFNKTDKQQQLTKGTKIISSNNLDFTLDDDVNIASTSSFSTQFSSSQVKVTASNFGKEYNLPSGTNFTVNGIATTDLFAKNDSAFSGGTKETIQVVSQKDLQDLQNTITSRLFDKAKSIAQSKISGNQALIPVMIASNFTNKNFDHKENDASKTVKLTATVDYTLGVYQKDELVNFLTSSSSFNVPKDFKLSSSDSSITISNITQNKNGIGAQLSFNAIFKPQLSLNLIPGQIVGNSMSTALVKLKKIPGVSDATILFSNNLPFLPSLLPFRNGNISIKLKTQ